MIEKLQKKYALSRQGAKDLVKGCIACFFQNLSLMLPVVLLYYIVSDLMAGDAGYRKGFYIGGCVICIILILVTTLFQYNSTYFATYIESGVRRINIAEKLRKLPLFYFGKRDLADLTSTIMNDSAVLETAFSHFIPELVGSVASTTIVALGILAFDWKMALAALWVLPVSFAIVLSSSHFQQKLGRKQMDAKMACADGIQECIETVQDLKSNNAEKQYLKGLFKKVDNVEKRMVISEFGNAAFVVSASLVLKLGIASVALTGTYLLRSGKLDVLTFFMFLLVASRLYDPLQGALQNLAAIISTKTNIARMNEILNHDVQIGSEKLTNKGFDIKFDHVKFAYDTSDTILEDVSFTAKQGEVTALVGPSGGGKTTVSRLAARFWDASSGKITVGGMDVSKTDPETLFSLYSIVFQDVTLFNNTIMENIRIGRKDATDEEVIEAAKLANCDEFAMKLPDKWNSMIGENGCGLSGGERQRISIARAFLKNPPILIFDEATSALDNESERYIQNSLDELAKGRTTLVIAHRLSTIVNADKIYVIEKGSVKENGTHKELLEKNGIYAKYYNMQFKQ